MELMNRAENQSQGGSPPSSTIINFGELSNDVLLHIFSMCSARTVAQLRQSCKQLRRLSNDQTVWLAVLKTTCTELSLPVPTFLQKAFSRSDIELLATSWIRFQWVLRNAKDAQVPTPRMVRRIGIIERVYSLELSPDGQFLFILTSSGIQIYTLQSPSPILVASFAIDIPEDGWAALISLIEDNHSFIIFLHVVARLPRYILISHHLFSTLKWY
ncbi:hypothetical protein DL96DRAFT_1617060 [Flagelloscypha sp. PMI_526]|nr:hypothetical protein DL96DRAFT_1617060 [Flagelloscypha sp. PMI_526]